MPDPKPESDPTLATNGWLPFILGSLVVVGIVQVSILPTNSDAAWYLYMAGRILDGARPYRDVVDTNPPLIVFLNIAIVALGRAIGVSAEVVLPAVLLVLSGLSLVLSWRLSRGLPPALRRAGLITWTLLLLVHPGTMFGQREHLLLILVLPAMFASIADARGERPSRRLAVASGVMAGFGFGLKPFFVPTVIAVEIYVAVRRGPRVWVRPQALALAAVFLIYGAAMVAWTPQYFDVARELAPLYPHHGPAGPVLLASSWRLVLVVGAVALAWFVGRRFAPEWGEVFGLLALGVTAAVYLTGKGWNYHWLPACSVAIALCMGSGVLLASQLRAGRLRRYAFVALALVPLAQATHSLCSSATLWHDRQPEQLVRRHVAEGESLLVLSPWLHRSFPMVNETGVGWGMRHPMLWQIAAFYADGSWSRGGYHALEAMTPPERRFVGEVAADFARSRPALLMIDDTPPRPSLPGFDYLRYFSADPRFARTLREYERLTCTITFRVYRRRPERGSSPDAVALRP